MSIAGWFKRNAEISAIKKGQAKVKAKNPYSISDKELENKSIFAAIVAAINDSPETVKYNMDAKSWGPVLIKLSQNSEYSETYKNFSRVLMRGFVLDNKSDNRKAYSKLNTMIATLTQQSTDNCQISLNSLWLASSDKTAEVDAKAIQENFMLALFESLNNPKLSEANKNAITSFLSEKLQTHLVNQPNIGFCNKLEESLKNFKGTFPKIEEITSNNTQVLNNLKKNEQQIARNTHNEILKRYQTLIDAVRVETKQPGVELSKEGKLLERMISYLEDINKLNIVDWSDHFNQLVERHRKTSDPETNLTWTSLSTGLANLQDRWNSKNGSISKGDCLNALKNLLNTEIRKKNAAVVQQNNNNPTPVAYARTTAADAAKPQDVNDTQVSKIKPTFK